VLHATRQGSPVSKAVEAQFALTTSAFRPAICEVTIGELWAFAQGWGPNRRALLERIVSQMIVIPIGDDRILRQWGALYSHAKGNGWAMQQDHNDVWIAATSHVAGTTLLSTDGAAFRVCRGTSWLDVILLDPRTGMIVP
jgi:predicted nucleic acid-binding protein